jgi:hypothetical protein
VSEKTSIVAINAIYEKNCIGGELGTNKIVVQRMKFLPDIVGISSQFMTVMHNRF